MHLTKCRLNEKFFLHIFSSSIIVYHTIEGLFFTILENTNNNSHFFFRQRQFAYNMSSRFVEVQIQSPRYIDFYINFWYPLINRRGSVYGRYCGREEHLPHSLCFDDGENNTWCTLHKEKVVQLTENHQL